MSDRQQRLHEEIRLNLDAVPLCPRCGDAGLLVARFAFMWQNQRDKDVSGLKEALLCSACDHEDPAAAELLALFAVDGLVGPENLGVFGGLVAAWVESVRHRTVDEELLGAQFEQRKRGEL
ncbi:DUF6300 family protein [Streptomyces sp. NPDC004230]